MDAWNKLVGQLTDVFKSMSPGARLTAGLLLAAVVVGAGFVFKMPSGAADDFLLAGRSFSPSELTSAQRAFAEAGLTQFEVEGTKIRVPRGQRAAYIAALAEHNAIPPDFFSYYTKALASDNPFVSQKVMDEKIRTAKQQELSQFINKFRGIEEAAVMYSEVDKPGFKREKLKTAAVTVRTTGGGLEESQVRAIRDLVAFAYAGLDRNSISITDTSTGRSYVGADGIDGETGAGAYLAQKSKFESIWKRKIEERLANISGVIVGVNVELDPEVRSQSSTVKFDDKPKAVKTSEQTSESTSTAPDVGGPAGARANNVGDGFRGNQPAQVSSTSSGPQSQQNSSKNETVNVLGREVATKVRAPLIPAEVRCSIDIPRSYLSKVWNSMHPPVDGKAANAPTVDDLNLIQQQTKTRVEASVNALLPPKTEDNDPYPRTVVTFYEDLPVAKAAPPSFAATAGQWAGDYWQSVAAFLLAIFALIMLRSMVGGAVPTPTAPAAIAAEANATAAATGSAEAATEEAKAESALQQRRRLNSSGPNLREELRELVREDPDAAANVLKVWIGDAA